METDIRIACIPVGNAWPANAQSLFRTLTETLPDRIKLFLHTPLIREPDILRQLEKARESDPALLLLPALHGDSARSLTLAGSRLPVPAAIWCYNQNHSLASSSLAAAALDQLGHPRTLINGESPSAAAELQAAAEAAAARNCLSKARIGRLGPLHFNLISSEVRPLTLYGRLGTWVVPLSIASVKARMKRIQTKKIEEMLDSFRRNYTLNADEEVLRRAMKLHAALKEIAAEEQLDAIAIDCWNEVLPEFHVSPCLGFAEDSYRIACEGDLSLAAALIAGEAICGKPGYTGDFYSFNEEAGEAVLVHCGGCAALHSGSEKMEISVQPPPKTVDQGGAVLSCRPLLRPGIGTLVLLHGGELDRLKLCSCEIAGTELRNQMQLKVRIRGNYREFRQESSGNHYVVFPGDHQESWKLWALWSRIRVH